MSVRRVLFVLAGLALVASGLVARVATPAVAGPGPTYSLATVGAFGGEPSIASGSRGALYETTPICHVGYQVTGNVVHRLADALLPDPGHQLVSGLPVRGWVPACRSSCLPRPPECGISR